MMVTSLTFQGHVTLSVTCDHLIAHRPFPIGGHLEPSLYLSLFPRYSMANVTQWLTCPWNDL